jgi:hypothetical protein
MEVTRWRPAVRAANGASGVVSSGSQDQRPVSLAYQPTASSTFLSETLNRTSRGGQRGDGNGNWPEVLTDSLTFVQPRDAVVSMFLKPLQFFLNTLISIHTII